jgi:hypothetical protein
VIAMQSNWICLSILNDSLHHDEAIKNNIFQKNIIFKKTKLFTKNAFFKIANIYRKYFSSCVSEKGVHFSI